jgi:hypothetical protein
MPEVAPDSLSVPAALAGTPSVSWAVDIVTLALPVTAFVLVA